MPPTYTSGQDYVLNSNMWSPYRWGTDMEILVLLQLTGHDVHVYSQHKHWVQYSPNMKHSDPKTATAFYLNNQSGAHFDPVLTSLKW